jgi:hypothetical protein
MKMISAFGFCAAALVLAGCGGGGGINFGNPLGVEESLATGPTDTMTASINRGDGVSGVISLAEISLAGASAGLSAFRVEISGAGSIATVYAGGNIYVLPLLDSGSGYRRFGSETGTLLQLNEAGTHQLATFSQTGGATALAGFGYLGIETPISQLPSGPVEYTGSWGGQAYSDDLLSSGVVLGDMTALVDFDGGTVSGTFDGTLNTGDVTDFSGTLSGSTSGNGITGTMNVTTGATGDVDFAGNSYGWNEGVIAGGVAGSINDGSDNFTVTGTFLISD